MWHTTCMQINQGDSWILVVGNQISNLTFGHNLCFKYSNGTCEPIFIRTSVDFNTFVACLLACFATCLFEELNSHVLLEPKKNFKSVKETKGGYVCIYLPINIYILKVFQWYKELFNPMSFDPCNRSLKIRESIKIPTPKMGAHLKCVGSFLPTLLHCWEHEMWLLSFTFGPHLCKPLLWS
jgi:hypothetical protein